MTSLRDKNPLLDRIVIEPMRECDLDQVLAVEKASFRHPWSRAGFKAELHRACAVSLVVREKEEVLGYLVFWAIREEIHILNLVLRSDRRRMGLGRFLLEYMFDWGRKRKLRRIFLEVRVFNLPARKLYEQAGFIMTGRRKNYYAEDQEDAILMARSL
ncbi:MAG: ribosomal protein S18-alanine N-acetyltransferase [Deltaproteobacteria bacterium]|nr:ribosomal protein S18-alanine N-acetyltransferase [Deltaproteobacteria bacterium]